MSVNQTAREFIRSCRQEYVPSPCKREDKFHGLFYSQFGGYLGEFPHIHDLIDEKLSDRGMIGRLINSIDMDERSHYRKLSRDLRQLKQLIYSYAKEEDLAEGYYNQMYQWLEAYAALVDSIQALIERQLVLELKTLYASRSHLDIEYYKRLQNVYGMWAQIEFYMDGIVEYREQFHLLSRNEQRNNDKTLVYSRIGFCLSKLVERTNKLIDSLNKSGRRLELWTKWREKIEKQEINN